MAKGAGEGKAADAKPTRAQRIEYMVSEQGFNHHAAAIRDDMYSKMNRGIMPGVPSALKFLHAQAGSHPSKIRTALRQHRVLEGEEAYHSVFPSAFGDGVLRLNAVETAVLSTPEFTRLGDIQQLGQMSTRFHEAHQTRWGHSLEVLKLTDMVAKRLDISAYDRRHLRMAALLHDIGHSAFSHYGDKIMAMELGLTHEDVALQLVDSPRFSAIFAKHHLNPGRLKSFLRGEGLGNLISGDFGTDRMAYLISDTEYALLRSGEGHLAGMAGLILNRPHGIGDIVADVSAHLAVHGGRVVLKKSGLPHARDFLAYRGFMYRNVYREPESVLARARVEHLLDLSIQRGLLSPGDLPRSTDSYVDGRARSDPALWNLSSEGNPTMDQYGVVFSRSDLNAAGQAKLDSGELAAKLRETLSPLPSEDHFLTHLKFDPAVQQIDVLHRTRVRKVPITLPSECVAPEQFAVGWLRRHDEAAWPLVKAALEPYLRAKS